MNITLINPDKQGKLFSEIPTFIQYFTDSLPPLGLLSLQTFLRKNSHHRAKIFNMDNHDLLSLKKYLMRAKPDCIGITVYTHYLVPVHRVLSFIRNHSNIPIIAGGPHVAAFPKSLINSGLADYEVIGEGESPLCDLLNSLEYSDENTNIPGLITKSTRNIPSFAYEKNFEEFSWPSPLSSSTKHILAGKKAIALQTSRGCPYSCNFCSAPKVPYRRQSYEKIANYFKFLGELGYKHIEILDDIFNDDPIFLRNFCEQLLSFSNSITWSMRGRADKINFKLCKLMSKAGCTRINLGIETWSDEGLSLLNKGISTVNAVNSIKYCKKANIKTVAYMMLGCPHEKSPQDVKKLFEFTKKLNPDYALFGVLTPYPNTKLWNDTIEEIPKISIEWRRFINKPKKGYRPMPWTKYMDRGTLYRLCKTGYVDFYFRPSKIFEHLVNGELMNKISASLRFLG